VDLLGDLLGEITVGGNGQTSQQQQQQDNNNKDPSSPNAHSSISGGVARTSAKKDPFADLFG
jgi:hypothetical protein